MTGSHPDGPRKLRSASKSKSTQEETRPNTTATENTPVGDEDNGLMTPKRTTAKSSSCTSCRKVMSSSDEGLDCDCCKDLIYCSLCKEKFPSNIDHSHCPSSSCNTPTLKMKSKYCGSTCNTLIIGDDDFLTCERCAHDFHLSCTSFDAEVFALMKKKNSFGDVLWRCSACSTLTSEDSNNFLLKEMINELRSRIEIIQEEMKNLVRNSERKEASTQPPRPIFQQNDSTKHTIVVKSKESEDNTFSEETWSSVVKNSIKPNLI